MDRNFDKIVKPEIIVLSGFKSIKSSYYGYYDTWSMEWEKEKKEPNKSKEIIKAEIKEEIEKNINKFEKESNEKYYKFNNEKAQEIGQKFKQTKLKINFCSKPEILRDGKFYTISKGCFTVYNDKPFNKLYEINFEKNYNISSAIQLDNSDLVFFAEDQLIIYRLKNDKYSLFQIIDENYAGYEQQESRSGCMLYPKDYQAEFIKDISGNRFILVSNYGFKIYSLNGKNEYSIVLLETYHEGLKIIHELDKNTFIFCTKIFCGDSLGGPAHDVLIIDKIYLRKISKDEKIKKLSAIKELTDYDFDYFSYRKKKQTKKISYDEIKKKLESVEIIYNKQQFLEYSTYGGHHYFKGNTILKNKFLVVGIDSNILIFDIRTGKLIKNYKIFFKGKENLYKPDLYLRKWNNNNDNEFLINCYGNIILFELTNDNELKIISQSYFQDINGLKKFNENKNEFYDDGKNEDSYSRMNSLFSDDSKDNKNYCVSIYY